MEIRSRGPAAGRVGLPEPLVELLSEHREEQNRMREHARSSGRKVTAYSLAYRPAAQSELRLPPMEGAPQGKPVSVMAGSTTPDTRRPRFCLFLAFLSALSWGSWLVEHGDGRALPARHRPDQTYGRGPSWLFALGRAEGVSECQLRPKLRPRLLW